MKPAIQVDNLSKVYRVNLGDRRGSAGSAGNGKAGGAAGNGRAGLPSWIKVPLHRLRHGATHSVHTEEFWALDRISFEVQRGEVLGIIGRNGAGKSTLLKILSRITVPTSGRALIDGRVGSLLEVGTGFHPDLSGRENVFLNGAILGMTRREISEKFDEIVQFAGVERFIDTPVKRYSSGMRVRLGFGVAAFLQPEILIIDEVLAVGDVEFQRRCLGKMGEVAQSGRTVMFVSHNMGAIQQLTERCMLIEGGRILTDGPTENTVEQYLRLQTDAAVGEINESMHKFRRGVRFLRAQILADDGTPTTTPMNFSPLELVVDLHVDEPLPEVVLTFGFNTIEGLSLVRYANDGEALGGLPVEPGVHRVRLGFELPLNPGPLVLMLRADRNMRYATQLAVVNAALHIDLMESRPLGLESGKKICQQSLLPWEAQWQPGQKLE